MRLTPFAPIVLAMAGLGLSACSTVITGTHQTIRFNSDPTQAHCVLTRDAKIIAKVTTPGRVEVDRDKRDILAVCSLDEYEDKMVTLRSQLEPAAFANVISTLGVGWTVDTITGADNSYPEVVTVILRKPKPKPKAAAQPTAEGT